MDYINEYTVYKGSIRYCQIHTAPHPPLQKAMGDGGTQVYMKREKAIVVGGFVLLYGECGLCNKKN